MEGLLLIPITYRSIAGEFIGTLQPPKGWTLGDLKAEIDRARAAHGGDLRAYMTVTARAVTERRTA